MTHRRIRLAVALGFSVGAVVTAACGGDDNIGGGDGGNEDDAATSDVGSSDVTTSDVNQPSDSGGKDSGEDAGIVDASDLDVDASCPFGSVFCASSCVPVDTTNCGACDFGCFSGQTCGLPDAGIDAGAQPYTCEGVGPNAPRQIAPLSGMMMTTRRPTFRITSIPSGFATAHVEVCSDAACMNPIMDVETANSVTASSDLPVGAAFWRTYVASGTHLVSSPVWTLSIPLTSAPHESYPKLSRDFDGDGTGDIVAYSTVDSFGGASPSSGACYVFYGRSGGPSETWAEKLDAFTTSSSLGLDEPVIYPPSYLGDFDRDGHPDLSSSLSDESSIFYSVAYFGASSGLHSGTNALYLPPVSFGSNGDLAHPTGDLDGDGFANYLQTSSTKFASLDGNAARTRGTDGTIFTDPPITGGISGFAMPSLAIGDVNLDGYSDFAVADHQGSGRVYVFLGSATGAQFGTSTVLVGSYPGSESFGIAMDSGDIDGDGYPDVVVAGAYIYVFRGGAGGVAVAPTWTLKPNLTLADGGTGTAITSFGTGLAVADFDGDGYADIATTGTISGTSQILVYKGGASPPANYTWSLLPLNPPGDVFHYLATPGDANGDGYPDIVGGIVGTAVYYYTGGAAGPVKSTTSPYMPIPYAVTGLAN